MSQMGMNMPGQIRRGSAPMDVYTGILAFAVVALTAACVFVAMEGGKIGKDGSPIGLQGKPQGGTSGLSFAK
jgi:hypothetical protein